MDSPKRLLPGFRQSRFRGRGRGHPSKREAEKTFVDLKCLLPQVYTEDTEVSASKIRAHQLELEIKVGTKGQGLDASPRPSHGVNRPLSVTAEAWGRARTWTIIRHLLPSAVQPSQSPGLRARILPSFILSLVPALKTRVAG